MKALAARGHRVVFIEKDVAWYRENRDLPSPAFCKLELYEEWQSRSRYLVEICRDADAVVVGSYFPDAILASEAILEAGFGPLLFYDIDTPITMAGLRSIGSTEYLDCSLVPLYDAYLSFTGGPALVQLEARFGARRTFPLYCSVDPDMYQPSPVREEYRCHLSYLGTYAADRQPKLMRLLNGPSQLLPEGRFIVAGPLYPQEIAWSFGVKRMTHVAPSEHAAFYSSAKFTLNLTRADMVSAGYSPSVRLFEASACGAAILSDDWEGIDEFFTPGEQILLPRDEHDVVDIILNLSDAERTSIGRRARERTLAHHTSMHRALQFEEIIASVGSSAMDPSQAPQTMPDKGQAHTAAAVPGSTLL